MSSGRLEKLGCDSISLLRSSITITSVEQACEELLSNSVDSGSSNIEVRYNSQTLSIAVSDNGHGISKSDMVLIGERHVTSKCSELSDLENITTCGFRGEALSSLAQISTFSIVTRTLNSNEVLTKELRGGAVTHFAKLPESARATGTTVSARELFANMPVRRKHAHSQRGGLERVKQRVLRYALANPKIRFRLTDESRGADVLQTRSSGSVLRTFKQLFPSKVPESMHSLESPGEAEYRITGIISDLEHGYHSRELQFLYVNGRFIRTPALTKFIGNFMDRCHRLLMMKQSGLGALDLPLSQDSSPQKFGYLRKFERVFPAYVIDLRTDPRNVEVLYDPAKTLLDFRDWDSALDALHKSLAVFVLKAHPILESVEDKIARIGKAYFDCIKEDLQSRKSEKNPEKRYLTSAMKSVLALVPRSSGDVGNSTKASDYILSKISDLKHVPRRVRPGCTQFVKSCKATAQCGTAQSGTAQSDRVHSATAHSATTHSATARSADAHSTTAHSATAKTTVHETTTQDTTAQETTVQDTTGRKTTKRVITAVKTTDEQSLVNVEGFKGSRAKSSNSVNDSNQRLLSSSPMREIDKFKSMRLPQFSSQLLSSDSDSESRCDENSKRPNSEITTNGRSTTAPDTSPPPPQRETSKSRSIPVEWGLSSPSSITTLGSNIQSDSVSPGQINSPVQESYVSKSEIRPKNRGSSLGSNIQSDSVSPCQTHSSTQESSIIKSKIR
eukprot:780436_1